MRTFYPHARADSAFCFVVLYNLYINYYRDKERYDMKQETDHTPKIVKLTIQITDVERKAWKRYALDNDTSVTDVIKKSMQKLIAKSKKDA